MAVPLTTYLATAVADHSCTALLDCSGKMAHFWPGQCLLALGVTIETGLTGSGDVSLTAIPSALPHIPS